VIPGGVLLVPDRERTAYGTYVQWADGSVTTRVTVVVFAVLGYVRLVKNELGT
jgi:hypothetical protein